MVEAALIVPMIILVIVGIIQINAALYHLVEVNCRNHSAELNAVNDSGELDGFIRKVDFMKGLLEE